MSCQKVGRQKVFGQKLGGVTKQSAIENQDYENLQLPNLLCATDMYEMKFCTKEIQ